jgi:hypothetical protein
LPWQKILLKSSFEILQRYYKGVKSEIGIAFWSQVYVYILSMGKDRLRVENTPWLFYRDIAPSMDRD